MFELWKQRAKLISFSPNAECHGEDRVPVSYMKITANLSNDCLAFFHPSLKSALYVRNDNASNVRPKQPEQGELIDGKPTEAAAPADGLTALRFSALGGPLKWDWKGVGYDIEIPYGVSGKADIVLKVDIDEIRLDCQEGGTVVITFRAMAHPTEEQNGRLCSLIQSEIEVTLSPPEAESVGDTPAFDKAGDPTKNSVGSADGWPFPEGEKKRGVRKPRDGAALN